MSAVEAAGSHHLQASASGSGLSRDAIIELVLGALKEVLPRQKRKQEFALSATLFKDIGMDSMQVLSFTFSLEQRLGKTLPEEELRRRPIESLEDVVQLIARVA
jgi:acyl carrier protein